MRATTQERECPKGQGLGVLSQRQLQGDVQNPRRIPIHGTQPPKAPNVVDEGITTFHFTESSMLNIKNDLFQAFFTDFAVSRTTEFPKP